MKRMTAVTVLRSVDVSDDGIKIRRIEAGTEAEVPSSAFNGLKAEGYVRAIGEAADEAVGDLALPESWRDFHHLKIIAIAKTLNSAVATKADAIAVLEAYESSKAA